MDSSMPWIIARNFVRAFAPTLAVVILWDLARNLSHLSTTPRWAAVSDGVALGVVIAIRLAPPSKGLREQLMEYMRWKWEALFGASILLTLLLFHKLPQSDPLDILLGLAACAFYADLARVCRIEYETSRKTIRAICVAYGFIAALLSGVVSSVAQIREGAFPREDLAYFVLTLVVLVILGFKWWGQGAEPSPVVQELGLNRQDPS